MDLFRIISDRNGPIISKELASCSGGEELLIGIYYNSSNSSLGRPHNLTSVIVRVLRPLAAIGFVDEMGEKTWEANPVTKAMATEQIASGHRMVYVFPTPRPGAAKLFGIRELTPKQIEAK